MKKVYFTLTFFLALSLAKVLAQDEFALLEQVYVADSTFLIEEGKASYYGTRFHLRKTANGDVYNMEEMTAAHKHLPFGTILRVVNLKNNKEVWVKVNDRLPPSSKRVIDLSKGAARSLEMIRDGVVPVRLEVPNQETIVSLIDYYQENKPEGMRLRLYPEPLEFVRPSIDLLELLIDNQNERVFGSIK
ncbi:septal ring lytic transglycosylase RlpA family protein [Belliella kenyensis]|uniref:Probable endolytic peptidoglycan transglycosylase RlpA n=1 Tax=Belliella kenyensis TaxID=1472724 RepID=A0ABV8ETU4_9BACT|nr:septal ring lytic transglycosylase RlpA family protein [Belliella kenyensis]MCH7402186.1 septal ring lytic transglycosylase RlpA family protein [Belliella kenyensis]MDN3601701.1 septal ring lytic transglycosylase RlpA family protein [Belliella kenyensis]